MCDLFIFACETSADVQGALIAKELLAKGLSIEGIVGPNLRNLRVGQVLPMEEFQVMGFVDVFLALPRLIKLFRQAKKAVLERNPKAVLFIDYPGLNLRMAKALRKAGYRGALIHFVCPSIWAWAKRRKKTLVETLDLLLTILPFEPALFTDTPLKAVYVGNPLVKKCAQHALRPLGKQCLSIFPGSRLQEIEKNLPRQLRAAQAVLQEFPDLTLAISVSQPKFEPLIRKMAPEALLVPGERAYDLMGSSKVALAKSGTVTLELALHGIPTVVTYAISPLDVFITRTLLRIILPFYALPNILLGRELFPEFIGPNFKEKAVEDSLRRFLADDLQEARCKKGCEELRRLLSDRDAALEASSQILPLCCRT